MEFVRTLPTRRALQALFARAAARRAERSVFVRTLREILSRRMTLGSVLLLKQDRRRTPRDTAHADPSWVLDTD
jgi:hypothetical protein